LTSLRLVVAVALFHLAPVLLTAQSQILFRYDPVIDQPVQTMFQTIAHTATADGRIIETADLGEMSAVAMAVEGGGTVVHMVYDSVRAMIRSQGGEWRSFQVEGADSTWLQVKVDGRLGVLDASRGPQLDGVTGLLGVLTGIPGLELPEHPVSVGGSWIVRSSLSERVRNAVPRTMVTLPSLEYSTRMTLDSIVLRTHDTLAYMSYSGSIRGATESDIRALSDMGIEMSSSMRGQLVWSTGWRRFVTGVVDVTMEIWEQTSITGPSLRRSTPTLTVRVTTRYRVG